MTELTMAQTLQRAIMAAWAEVPGIESWERATQAAVAAKACDAEVAGLRTQLAAAAERVEEYRETTRDTVDHLYATIDRAVEAERDRDRLAGQVDAIRAKCEEWAKLAPEDDWGDDLGDTALADAGRYLLAILASPPPPPQNGDQP